MGLFGKSKPSDPKEQVKKWKQQMRAEERKVDRQITSARGAVGSATRPRETACPDPRQK